MTLLERRRSALVFTGLLVLGALTGYLFWPLPQRWPWVLSGGADGLLFVGLLVFGARGGRSADLVIAAGAAVTLAQTWVTNQLAIASGHRFELFEAYKLLSLGLALLAPSRLGVGLGAIGATGVLAAVQASLWPPAVREELPAAEPWMTVFYCAVAFTLLLHRRRQLAVQRHLVRVETRAADAEGLMRKLLAVRDLANSPLQSIEATLAVLRQKYPDAIAQLDRLERQLDRLRKLSTVLSRYEPQTWTADDSSFDPLEVLQQLEDSPTKEFDRLFLLRPQRSGRYGRDRGEEIGHEDLEQLLRFTSFGLEHSPVCAFWLGSDGRLVYVNQASCESLGYSRSELLGMHISSFAPRVSRDGWRRRFEWFGRQTNRPEPYTSVHRRKDGTLIPVEISASYAELNGRGYILGFARELTEGRRSADSGRVTGPSVEDMER